MQPCAYRCRTAADHFRDLLCTVALHIVQPHRDSLIVRQCVYRLPQLTAAFRFRSGSIRGSFHRCGALKPRRTAKIGAPAERYAQQPCFQVLFALEAAIVAQQLFENILHHIFRIGGAAAVVHGGSEHRVTVSLHG